MFKLWYASVFQVDCHWIKRMRLNLKVLVFKVFSKRFSSNILMKFIFMHAEHIFADVYWKNNCRVINTQSKNTEDKTMEMSKLSTYNFMDRTNLHSCLFCLQDIWYLSAIYMLCFSNLRMICAYHVRWLLFCDCLKFDHIRYVSMCQVHIFHKSYKPLKQQRQHLLSAICQQCT